MCHSVEMYLPEMTRRAAETRIGAADSAAAGRRHRAAEAGAGLAARLRAWLTQGITTGATQEQARHG